MRYLSSDASRRRRGVVLLVVLAMLALFASVALSFVFYADSEAVSAKLTSDALVQTQVDIDPEMLAAHFLGQLLYDTNNLQSAARGWSMGRGVYGWNPHALNVTPYNGNPRSILQYGTPQTPPTAANADNELQYVVNGVPGVKGYGLDNAFNMVNYQVFWDPNPANAKDKTINFLRTPEFYDKVYFAPGSFIPDPSQFSNPASPYVPIAGTRAPIGYRYVGGANPPWTTYDTANLFLAQVDSNGKVLMPSFYRKWHQTLIGLPTVPANPVPNPARLTKYTQLYPDSDWNPAFSLPDADANGHVRNLEGGANVNDSNWMDFGFPVMTAPDGTRYKVLFAPLVMDISNRLHLWAHGNRIGGTANAPSHVSNMGVGPTEVNLSYLTGGAINAELENLFSAKYDTSVANNKNATPSGTYLAALPVPQGFTNLPGLPNQYRKGTWYSKLDGDGLDPVNKASTRQFLLPAPATALNFPTFVNGTSNWDNLNDVGGVDQLKNKPLALNPYNPAFPNARMWGAGSMEALFRYNGTNSPAASTELLRLMPNTFANPNTRNLVTLASNHFDRPVSAPVISYNNANQYSFNQFASPAQRFPSWTAAPTAPNFGTSPPSPAASSISMFGNVASGSKNIGALTGLTSTANISVGMQVLGKGVPAGTTVTAITNATTVKISQNATATVTGGQLTFWNPIGDLSGDWRSTLGNSLRVDLNRPLTEYATNSTQAIADRQQFAQDIYLALLQATVGSPQNPPTPFTPALAKQFADLSTAANPNNVPLSKYGARWLAQLAVNIVDFIDDDDCITPFQWYPGEWVYGTELPGLVLNEIYVQNDNDPNDPTIAKPVIIAKKPAPKASYSVLNVWAELLNPFDQTSIKATPASLVRGTTNLAAGAQPIYEVVVCKADPNASPTLSAWMRDPTNNDGSPLAASVLSTATDWAPTTVPAKGFYVLGPKAKFLPGTNPTLPASHQSTSMSINMGKTYIGGAVPPSLTLLLRRLACPTLPFNNNVKSPNYNPFITTDYVENIPARSGLVFDVNGPVANPPLNLYRSFGREQPYTAFQSQVILQAPENGVAAPQVQHSFLGKNTQLTFKLTLPIKKTFPPSNGSGYNHFPTVQLNPVLGAPFAVQSVMGIETTADPDSNPTILNRGSGYTSAPTVTFSGGGAPPWAQAQATATISKAGRLQSITMISGGAYTTIPTITLSGGGFGAVQAQVSMGTPGTNNCNITQNITKVTWTKGVATFNTTGTSSKFIANNNVTIAGMAPAGYNGTFPILNVGATTTTFDVAIPKDPGPPTGFGKATTTFNTFNFVGVQVANSGANNFVSAPNVQIIYPPAASLPNGFLPLGQGATATAFVETPYDWLVHLDRAPVNSLELLNVSAGKPHELTQQFKTPLTANIVPMLTATVASATEAGKVATITTTLPHNMDVGWRVTIAGVADPGYNGTFTITSLLSTTSFKINTGVAGLKNVGAGGTVTSIGAQENNHAVTLHTTVKHGFNGTQWMVISGVANDSYNGLFSVTASTPTTLTYQTNTRDAATKNLPISGDGIVYPYSPPANSFQHMAPWNPYVQLGNTQTSTNMQNTLLYRALETMSTSSHLAGEIPGGRRIGNINLNTVMDPAIFIALCDPQPNQIITAKQVGAAWTDLITKRNLSTTTAPTSEPTTPFQTFGAAKVSDTWFRPGAAGTPMFNMPGQAHPYQTGALLQKIYNNVTTTSNTFAVWWTVGYFQVTDETVQPPRLGQEIGRNQNRHVRHRFFAIVDRSAMELQRRTADTIKAPLAANSTNVTFLADGQPWLFQSGMNLEVLSAPSQVAGEVVTVTGINPATNSITVSNPNNTKGGLLNAYPTGAIFVLRGNPGPKDGNPLAFSTSIQKNTTVVAGPNATMKLNAIKGNFNGGQAWNIQPGMLLQVADPANPEIVFVKAVTAGVGVTGTITADFLFAHANNTPVMMWQQPPYNPHVDPAVLFMSIIK